MLNMIIVKFNMVRKTFRRIANGLYCRAHISV